MPETIIIQDDNVIQVLDPVEALQMLATANMRPFTKDDWLGFAGCETKDPMIGEFESFTIVLDGDLVNIVHGDDGYGGTLFQLKRYEK